MRLVVVGGDAAGLSAASRARRLDSHLDITVLERGDRISYSACGIPYYIEGRVKRVSDLVHFSPEQFTRERNIKVRTGADVVSMAHGRREVVLRTGERVPYDKLVIATGARPNRSLPGADEAQALCLYTLPDSENLDRVLRERQPKRASVIGAGYLGLEAAEALRTRGLAVTIHDSRSHVLHWESAELTERVRALLERFGIELRLKTRVAKVDSSLGDLVVLSAGLKPNVELAAEAGVTLGNSGAIRTDDRMETNLTGIYAAGDCAETQHLITGRPAYLPLGTTANKTGRVAGANAAGHRDRFPGIVGTSIVRLCGVAFAMTGLSAARAKQEGFSPVSARIEQRERAAYFGGRPISVELIGDRQSGRLLGALVVGEEGVAGRINTVAAALTARMKVEDFAELDLAYAPPYATVWDPLLTAAKELEKELLR